MQFSKREFKLLEYLLHARKAYVTCLELSGELQVSERTIRNDVSKINQKDSLIDTKRGAGYYLSNRKLVVNYLEEVSQESWNRNVQLFKRLVEDGPCDFYEIVEVFYISESTLTNSIKQINSLLQMQGFAIEIARKNNQLFCIGSTMERKTALRKFLLDEVVENELDIHILDSYFERFDCVRLKDDLIAYYQQMEIPILDYSLISVLLHLLLLLDTSQESPSSIVNSDSEDAFEKFISEISNYQKVTMKPEKIVEVKNILTSRDSKKTNEQEAFLSETILQVMLVEIKENYQLDLKNNQLFKQKFQGHILSLFERCQNRQFIKNPMLSEIKRKFSLIYDISATVIVELQKQISFVIPEDEIGYIALHLISVIEDLKAEVVTIQIVESFSQTITEYLRNLIYANYPESKIIVTPKLSFKVVTDEEVDLILSFVPLDIISTIPVYYLDSKLLSDGESELMAFIRKIKYEKRFRDFKIKNYFSEKFYYPQIEVENKQELLHQMCCDLEKKGVVNSLFERSVFERETVAPTSFGGVLAIPHATKKVSQESIVSVATMKKALDWGGDQVSVVCLFALAPDFNDADRLYSYLLTAVENPVTLREMLSATTFTDFQKCLFIKN